MLSDLYYYSRCTEVQKSIYRLIEQAFRRQCYEIRIAIDEEQIDFFTVDECNKVLKMVLLDNPLFFQVDISRVTFRKCSEGMVVECGNLYSAEQYTALLSRIEQKGKEILRYTEEVQCIDKKMRFIHDYLCENVQYVSEDNNREIHTIVGAFVYERCVCDGLSGAFVYLCERVGITCARQNGMLTMDGKSTYHSWNMTEHQGIWYQTDVCLDLMFSKESICTEYFYKDKVFFQNTHKTEELCYEQ